MRSQKWLLFTLLVFSCPVVIVGQEQQAPVQIRLLRNSDVLRMLQDGVKPGMIIARIRTSGCNFDVFPPVVRDLKRRGVPDAVIAAMKAAPSGPPSAPDVETEQEPLTAKVRLLAGTLVEVESARAVSSANVSAGSPISFLVSRRVFVNNVLVINRGALAMAKVVSVKRAAAFGRAGMLAWEMEYVVGVDGKQIPINVGGKHSGKNRSVAIAGGAVATGALIFPYSSPVALIWGLKKGDEAVLRGSRVFNAVVRGETEIAGIQPRPGGVVYRDRETVKASAAPPTNTNFEQGYKAKGNSRP
jgi:hypothetical protein